MNYPKVILKSGKDQSVRRYHPWIFSGAIKKIIGNVNEGDLVMVTDNKDEFLALGHYQIGSIAVRIISFENNEINNNFWKQKIFNAYKLRKEFGLAENENNNVYLLVHAEGDGLPGLIIDFYNGTAVLQMHSIGMFLNKEAIIDALREVYGENLKAVYDKSESTIPFKSDIVAKNGYVFGASDDKTVLEYG
ncbi:MAG: RlmI/RlmK family 23S rRNA methyltransferase, partial [Marinilabiliales bacterium]